MQEQTAEIIVKVKGGTIRITVLVDIKTNRAAQLTISKPFVRSEVIKLHPWSELNGIYSAGQWDLQQLYDLLIPCPITV